MTRAKRGQYATAVRPWRVLVTGDNPDSVELISRLLAEAGHHLDRAQANY
ncbi:MAG: hypothetical protein JWL70_886, partial [Acidimicrobiia bacterium]|nr:hypothetical protein [Acidimicrobiia bacterium]